MIGQRSILARYLSEGILLCLALLWIANEAKAGAYNITPSIEQLSSGWLYSWEVTNVDQGYPDGSYAVGLDGFLILAPTETNVIDYVVPPPGIGGFGAYWNFREQLTEWRHSDNQLVIPAPQDGFKWLMFWGVGWDSVYYQGQTAVFSLTTDFATAPGQAYSEQVTFLGNEPRTNPEYYVTFFCDTIGPTTVPEPASTLTLLSIGLLAVIGCHWRYKIR
jgi:hypothetical protein